MKKYFRRFIMIYLIALLALPAFGMRASAETLDRKSVV